MDNKKLTVIIPVFNTDKYLERCLESVINQSYKNLEIIIINDGSTDNSHSIIDRYCGNNNITYIPLKKNCGLGNARNIGLDNATGEYVAFVDSDDWVDSNFYYTLIKYIEKYSLDIAVAGIINEYDDRKAFTYRYKYPFNNQITGKFALNLLIKSTNQDIYITPIVNNKVYKRDIIEHYNLRFLNDNYNEDDIFSFQLFNVIQSVGVIKDTYYHYYQRATSITGQFKQKHIDDLIFAYKYLINELKYDKFDKNVLSFFDRNLSFVFDLLFKSDFSVNDIKKYLTYALKRINELYSTEEIIQNIDINRIKQLLCIDYK